MIISVLLLAKVEWDVRQPFAPTIKFPNTFEKVQDSFRATKPSQIITKSVCFCFFDVFQFYNIFKRINPMYFS